MTKRASATAGKKPKTSVGTSTAREGQASVLALVPSVPSVQNPPSHDAIAQRAFELYQRREYAPGSALHDWLTAEHELRHS